MTTDDIELSDRISEMKDRVDGLAAAILGLKEDRGAVSGVYRLACDLSEQFETWLAEIDGHAEAREALDEADG